MAWTQGLLSPPKAGWGHHHSCCLTVSDLCKTHKQIIQGILQSFFGETKLWRGGSSQSKHSVIPLNSFLVSGSATLAMFGLWIREQNLCCSFAPLSKIACGYFSWIIVPSGSKSSHARDGLIKGKGKCSASYPTSCRKASTVSLFNGTFCQLKRPKLVVLVSCKIRGSPYGRHWT